MRNRLYYLVVTLLVVGGLYSCDSGDSNGKGYGQEKSDNGIQYLKNNHSSYFDTENNTDAPRSTQDKIKRSITWIIYGESVENAKQLKDHIDFMTEHLTQGKNPRPNDKLFLMEAYMKSNKKYTTETSINDKIVTVTKQAHTDCAYEVIESHSDAVSEDFFARGDIKQSYDVVAESILESASCEDEKDTIEAYINEKNI